ncbi:Hypothetical predicted protein [Cloeon dipterum]|uniref:C-type lectin domain-containing protein n=1 Tax=Cloeon dipterum TaxID=197152 RepID=A0A8S1CUX2_9INSE|nr:Hypothetical predicted protein [Cloeon dipterum]
MHAASSTKAPKLQKCTTGDCSVHDSRLRNFLSSALTEDFSSVMADSALSAFISKNAELGDVFYKCGRIFYSSHNQVRFADAILTCAKRKMQLVTVEEGEKNLNCLVPNLEQMTLEQQKNLKYFFIWTSGMAEGKSCGNAAYSWCAGNRTRIDNTAFDLPGEISRKERCLALSMMTKTLVRMECADPNYFFCEYKCKGVSCLKSCDKKNDTMDPSGKINRGKVNGIWAEWQRNFGINRVSFTSYVFGYQKVTWTENIKLCCSMGMKPIRVTDEFLTALNNAANEKGAIKIFTYPGNSTEDRELVKTSFWTAATRQGCAGQYRFCMHDDVGPWDSQDKFWDMVNPRDDGSCLVVDRQYTKAGTPFGVRQVQCSSKSANIACQKEGKKVEEIVSDFEIMNATDTCDLPYCTDVNYCKIMVEYAAKYENGERMILKPHILGEWMTSCGVRYLKAKQEMSWKDALDFCCSLGMHLVSVQSYEKLQCMNSILEPGSVSWTSGTNMGCENERYRWCSAEFKDFLKPSVNLKNQTLYSYPEGTSPQPATKYCVVALNSEAEGPTLGIDDCYKWHRPICTVRVKAESHVQEVFSECKLTHSISNRDIDKFNTVDLISFSYKMKCFMTCLAEMLGLIYESRKFWEDAVVKAIGRVKVSTLVQDFSTLLKKYPTKLFKKASDNLDALKMMLIEQQKEEDWKSTLLVNEALDRFWECNQMLDQFNKSHDECLFVFDFMKCFTKESASLEKFWNRNLDNTFDRRELAITTSKSESDIEQMIHYHRYDEDPVNTDIKNYVEYVDNLSFTEEVVSSRCIYRYLRPKSLTLKDACLEIMTNFLPTLVEDVFVNKVIDKKDRYPALVAAAKCARANGSLPTADQFISDTLRTLSAYLRNASKYLINEKDSRKEVLDSILLDEFYTNDQGIKYWCSNSEENNGYFYDSTPYFNYYYESQEGSPGYIGFAVDTEFFEISCGKSLDLKSDFEKFSIKRKAISGTCG